AVHREHRPGGGGAGAYVYHSAYLSGDLFQDNQCMGSACTGGGLKFVGDEFILVDPPPEPGSLVMTDTAFIDNQADIGGGVSQSNPFSHVAHGLSINTLFAGNRARSGHGNAFALAAPSEITLLYTTIASPSVGAGSAIYVANGQVGMTNTLIANVATGIEQV